MKLYELDEAIKAVCPIDGISCNGRIDYRPEATEQQRAAAQAIMDAELPNLESGL